MPEYEEVLSQIDKDIQDDFENQFEEITPELFERDEGMEDLPEDDEVDELTQGFVDRLVDKMMTFMDVLVGHSLHPYQTPFARRLMESVIIGDGKEITALASRQSGKSETIANTVATLMVLLPRLSKMYPDLLGKFKDGIWVGLFAPTEGQAETLFGRTVNRLTSPRALEILGDSEIDDVAAKIGGVTKMIKLRNSGSTITMMTANPRAKIESKTFHLIVIDECQEADDFVVNKSIAPMMAYYAGTMVKTGTPTTKKNDFYKSIQLNKRQQTGRKAKQNHFQWDWRDVSKVNDDYGKFIKKEMLRIGEDSDEFQMSYNCKWLLERGMFVTSNTMDELGDTSQELVKVWHKTPVVVGIDPARKMDSTVVTVVWVDWDRPDAFGYFDHRVLNWLELQGDDWEEQYFQIVNFLSNYDVLAIGVDANGVGDAVAQRLKLLMGRAEVVALTSSPTEQSKRFKHLQALIQRQCLSFPAHAKTRRLRVWKRFYQQMIDAEVQYKGPNFSVAAPNEAYAHDDFVDSLAIATSLTQELVMPEVEVSSSAFF
ncbi:Terminase RNaseH-like domain containing protein [uncultured Caudovirales phage]|uniref:Terminase RNaseH-like domain containing protein n=1 Tax=uncultured Caudovirales phage TaxID=2100421 RepID=A0A6J5L3J9_9CAUD|nr:Terminase RNaseH-like domain containing protein [uncultured Caudovirales phage]